MDLTLRREQLDTVAIPEEGALFVDSDSLAQILSEVQGMAGLRAAIADTEFDLLDDGDLDVSALTISGVWWWPIGEDVSVIGRFVVEGFRLNVEIEGVGGSPIAEGPEILSRAAGVIARQFPDSEYVAPGLFRLPEAHGSRLVRVVVTRDRRIERVPDMLDATDFSEFLNGRMGVIVVKGIGTRDSGIEQHFLWPDAPHWAEGDDPDRLQRLLKSQGYVF